MNSSRPAFGEHIAAFDYRALKTAVACEVSARWPASGRCEPRKRCARCPPAARSSPPLDLEALDLSNPNSSGLTVALSWNPHRAGSDL
jgi:hypothetical protein